MTSRCNSDQLLPHTGRPARRRWAHLLGAGTLALAACAGLTSCSSETLKLEVGQCLHSAELGDREKIKNVDTVSCEKDHDVEVYHVFTFDDAEEYPGDVETHDYASAQCAKEFGTFVGISIEDSVLDPLVIYPTEESWTKHDDRTGICLVKSPVDVTGTLKGSGK